MGEIRTHVTTFGGGSKIYVGIKCRDVPKLADTTVLEFGEQSTHHCTIYWVVCSLTFSFCVNQLNRSLIDIHLGPTDCGSASCFLVCVTYLQLYWHMWHSYWHATSIVTVCTDYASGADWFSCCITSLTSFQGHSHVQLWFHIVWWIEWHERIFPIPLYTAISPDGIPCMWQPLLEWWSFLEH